MSVACSDTEKGELMSVCQAQAVTTSDGRAVGWSERGH